MTGYVDVVTLGEAMQLLVAEPGVALSRARTFHASIAGAETNVAIGLARLGYRTRWLGRIGADPAGASVLAILRAEGVDTAAVDVDMERPTGLLMRDSHPARDIAVQYYRRGSAACGLSADFVRRNSLEGARVVHVSGITAMISSGAREAVWALVEAARESGALVSFDPNVRRKLGSAEQWRTAVGPIVAAADLVFAGADELELLAGPPAEDAVPALLAGRARSVLVKHADKSTTLTTHEGQWRQGPLARAVVDPVGAGDAVVAGYLGAWLHGAGPADALFAGAAAAALVVGAVTDTEGLPDQLDLARALRDRTGDLQTVDR